MYRNSELSLLKNENERLKREAARAEREYAELWELYQDLCDDLLTAREALKARPPRKSLWAEFRDWWSRQSRPIPPPTKKPRKTTKSR